MMLAAVLERLRLASGDDEPILSAAAGHDLVSVSRGDSEDHEPDRVGVCGRSGRDPVIVPCLRLGAARAVRARSLRRGRSAGIDRVGGGVVHLLAIAHVPALDGRAVRVGLDLAAVVGSAVLLPALVPPGDRGAVAVVLGSPHVHMQDRAGRLGSGGERMPDDRGRGGSDRTSVVAGDGDDRCDGNRGGGPHGGETNDHLRARPGHGRALRAWRCQDLSEQRLGGFVRRRVDVAVERVGAADEFHQVAFVGGRCRCHGAISLATDGCWGRGSACPARSSSRRRRRLARCRRTRNAAGDWPSTVAASAGRRPSHAISVIASRSFAGSRPSAAATRPAGSSTADRGVALPSARSRRRRSAPRRRDPRCWVAITFRATARSHGSESAGTSSTRRQATRNVLATTSSDVSPGARRRAYAATARW